MTRNALVTDLALAVLAAIVVLILTPGVAIAAMIAILVLFGCMTSFMLDSRRRSSRAVEAADDQRACDRAPETAGASVRRDCSPCRRWPI